MESSQNVNILGKTPHGCHIELMTSPANKERKANVWLRAVLTVMLRAVLRAVLRVMLRAVLRVMLRAVLRAVLKFYFRSF